MSVYIVKIIKSAEIAVKVHGPRDDDFIIEAAEDESGIDWPDEISVTKSSMSWEDAKRLSDGFVEILDPAH